MCIRDRPVDLDRREVPCAELQLPALCQAVGVEHAAPGFVAPARDADSNQLEPAATYANLSFFQAFSWRTRSSASWSVRSRRSGVIETYPWSNAQRSEASSVDSTGTTVYQ